MILDGDPGDHYLKAHAYCLHTAYRALASQVAFLGDLNAAMKYVAQARLRESRARRRLRVALPVPYGTIEVDYP